MAAIERGQIFLERLLGERRSSVLWNKFKSDLRGRPLGAKKILPRRSDEAVDPKRDSVMKKRIKLSSSAKTRSRDHNERQTLPSLEMTVRGEPQKGKSGKRR